MEKLNIILLFMYLQKYPTGKNKKKYVVIKLDKYGIY